ncbi:hypothetical protein HZS_1689 [Henneguya salminicola]|nr:hypothetical protein HZS_1689 [Henneguya salminicola]
MLKIHIFITGNLKI